MANGIETLFKEMDMGIKLGNAIAQANARAGEQFRELKNRLGSIELDLITLETQWMNGIANIQFIKRAIALGHEAYKENLACCCWSMNSAVANWEDDQDPEFPEEHYEEKTFLMDLEYLKGSIAGIRKNEQKLKDEIAKQRAETPVLLAKMKALEDEKKAILFYLGE